MDYGIITVLRMSPHPEAFTRNPSLVYDFYNNRRRDLNNGIIPNNAHLELVELEKTLKINIITQNIDNLHEVAGNSSIIYMHGELNKVRCIKNDTHIHYWTNDLDETHKCPDCGSQMRPHICWFGEMPFQMDEIHQKAEQSTLFRLHWRKPHPSAAKCIQLQALFPCLRK